MQVDLTWLRSGYQNDMDVRYKRVSTLSSPDRPCTADPGYDFTTCVDRYFSER